MSSIEGIYSLSSPELCLQPYKGNCLNGDRVQLATFLLKGNAYHWWKTVRRGYASPAVITWEEFQRIFYEQFYPHSYRNAKKFEFLHLKQGPISVVVTANTYPTMRALAQAADR
ncbi:unnamed protein product [Prunus armeniaca]